MGCFDCYSDCTGGCMTGCYTTCSGTCSNSCGASCSTYCRGYCTGTCSSSCGAACSSTCSNSCTGGCSGTCSGSCTDTCKGNCATTCAVACSSTCSNSCTGGCTGTCSSSCGAACSSSCSSGCTGGCKSTCSGSCTDGCKTNCYQGCSGTCSSACGAACTSTCSGGCTGTCSGGCSGTCSGTCTDGCLTTCYQGCTGNCSTVCSNACTGGCESTCTGSCVGECSGTCTGSCTDGCLTNCYQECSGNCSTQCTNDCTGGCDSSCTETCQGTCSATCADDCENGCNNSCSGQVVNPLGTPSINSIPSTITVGESFTFSGSWPNAYKVTTYVDGGSSSQTNGQSFSRSVSFNTAGQHSVKVSAKNTPASDDYGAESDSRTYTINVEAEVVLPPALGDLTMTQTVPSEVNVNESFTIAGDWPNADHIAVSTDGSNWVAHSGDSFTQTLSFSEIGSETIQIAARNTALDSEPGTERKEESFTVNVVDVQVEALGELSMTKFHSIVDVGNRYEIIGSWPNANHIKVSTDGTNWTTHSGESFTQMVEYHEISEKTIWFAARNTENSTDPGTDYKEETKVIQVRDLPIKVISLTNSSVKVRISDYVGKVMRLKRISDGVQISEKPAASEVEFNLLDFETEYRLYIFNSSDSSEGSEDFITYDDNIHVTSVSSSNLKLEMY